VCVCVNISDVRIETTGLGRKHSILLQNLGFHVMYVCYECAVKICIFAVLVIIFVYVPLSMLLFLNPLSSLAHSLSVTFLHMCCLLLLLHSFYDSEK
jgi:hypothetical protein